jgi:hypothetical protein
VLRDFNFCVIDEVDSILIDEARTPLIISGAAERPSAQYYQARGLPRSARGAPRAACRAARTGPPRRAAAPGRSSLVLPAFSHAVHCREGGSAAGAAGARRGACAARAHAERCSLLVHPAGRPPALPARALALPLRHQQRQPPARAGAAGPDAHRPRNLRCAALALNAPRAAPPGGAAGGRAAEGLPLHRGREAAQHPADRGRLRGGRGRAAGAPPAHARAALRPRSAPRAAPRRRRQPRPSSCAPAVRDSSLAARLPCSPVRARARAGGRCTEPRGAGLVGERPALQGINLP